MKLLRTLTLAACIAAIVSPATSYAGNKANKANKGDKANRPGKIIRQYDTNGNGLIDGTEVDAFKKAFEADKTGPLKQFDTNSDGTLGDSEISAIKGRVKGEKKKKNK